MYQIDKGVPVPQGSENRAGARKYPWNEMASGDSILVPIEEGEIKETKRRTVFNGAHAFVKRHRPGWRVITKFEEGGIRVWLVDQEVTALKVAKANQVSPTMKKMRTKKAK